MEKASVVNADAAESRNSSNIAVKVLILRIISDIFSAPVPYIPEVDLFSTCGLILGLVLGEILGGLILVLKKAVWGGL